MIQSKFKKISFEELKSIIIATNLDDIDHSDVVALLQFVPTAEEVIQSK